MKRALLVLAALVCALGLAGPAAADDERPKDIQYDTPGEFPQLSPDYKMTSHKVVLITDQDINPRTVTLDQGQLVAWISYSAAPTVVVFEREVAANMICHSLVNFSIKEDELRSAPIHAGEFASFCQLKPGRYVYHVTRPEGIERHDSRDRMRGVIIVGNPDDAKKKKKG